MIRRRQQRGVTLVELMIVVGIIAIFSALMFGLNSQTYGASATNVADQLASDFNVCKMRAVSTRRWTRCEVTGPAAASPATPQSLTMMQWQTTGMQVPVAGGVWSVVNTDVIGTGVSVWDGNSTVCALSPCASAPSTPNTSLVLDIDFRPDGSSTGGTIYVADPGKNKTYRVVVYKATGSSYARNTW